MIRINEIFYDNLWRDLTNYMQGTNYPQIEDKLPFGSQGSVYDDLPEEFNEILKAADMRMHQGKFRYGKIKRQNLSNYDTVEECKRRLDRYLKDNNLEHLVDAFNMIRIEFYKGKLQGKEIIPIDDGEHAKEINSFKLSGKTPTVHYKMPIIKNIINE